MLCTDNHSPLINQYHSVSFPWINKQICIQLQSQTIKTKSSENPWKLTSTKAGGRREEDRNICWAADRYVSAEDTQLKSIYERKTTSCDKAIPDGH